MNTDTRRITLVARNTAKCTRDWDTSNPVGSRLIFVDAVPFLAHAIQGNLGEQDIDRVIIDHTGNAEQYLHLVASLPQEFLGDVLYVGEDGGGFVSAAGRGGDRVMYSVQGQDIDFYLQAQRLLWQSPAEEQTAVA